MEHKNNESDYSVWSTLPIVESKAYSLEAAFTFLSGYTINEFGFMWCQQSNSGIVDSHSGFHYFIISSSGKFLIRSYNPQTKKTEPIKDWTDSPFIKTEENETNVFKITKFDNTIDKQLYFLINEEMIFQTSYLPIFGYETGFISFQNMKSSIVYFKATFYSDQT